MSTYYGPIASETTSEIRDDRFWVNSSVIYGMFYGIHVVTWGVTVYHLCQRLRTADSGHRINTFFLVFVTVLLGTGTVAFAGSTKLIELMFVDNRNYPSGPSGWWIDVGQFTSWIVLSDAGYYFSEALADGLLLYRTWVVWNKNPWIMIVPMILYLYVLGLGLPLMVIPSLNFIWFNVPLISSWFGCAAGLNIFLSVLIAGRLLYHARRVRQTFGHGHAQQYVSIVEIIVESAATYAALEILFIAFWARGDVLLANALAWPVLTQAVCIAPDLIILRGVLTAGRRHQQLPSSHFAPSHVRSAASGFAASAMRHESIALGAVQVKVDKEVVLDDDASSGGKRRDFGMAV